MPRSKPGALPLGDAPNTEISDVIGRGGWIRTNGCRDQNPVPYHLAIPLMRQNFNIFAVKCQGKLTVLQQMSVLSFFEKMAGAAGFEPTDAEIKTRCLTTWRRP